MRFVRSLHGYHLTVGQQRSPIVQYRRYHSCGPDRQLVFQYFTSFPVEILLDLANLFFGGRYDVVQWVAQSPDAAHQVTELEEF